MTESFALFEDSCRKAGTASYMSIVTGKNKKKGLILILNLDVSLSLSFPLFFFEYHLAFLLRTFEIDAKQS